MVNHAVKCLECCSPQKANLRCALSFVSIFPLPGHRSFAVKWRNYGANTQPVHKVIRDHWWSSDELYIRPCGLIHQQPTPVDPHTLLQSNAPRDCSTNRITPNVSSVIFLYLASPSLETTTTTLYYWLAACGTCLGSHVFWLLYLPVRCPHLGHILHGKIEI